MRKVLGPVSLLVFVGCNPHSASIGEGNVTAFLPVSSSRTLFNNVLDLEGFAAEGTREQIDCRDPDDVELLPDANPAFCGAIDDFDHERWLDYDAFEMLTLPLDPWRAEAVITSEGDYLMTFHNRLPGGRDFRFAIALDPGFQPTTCVLGDDGSSERVPLDGDWLGNWSADVDSGTLFYLNYGAYQFNPSNTEDVWILPDRWIAGFSIAKFAEEDFLSVSPRYGYPSVYESYDLEQAAFPDRDDLFYVSMPSGTDPTTDPGFLDLAAETVEVANEVAAEYAALGKTVTPRAHTNAWRTPSGDESGLDRWTELHYSWVRFDQAATDLTVGMPANGEFHLVMKGLDSPSRLLITGSFTVDSIKKDRWTVDDLTAEKLAEYGTELCGGSSDFTE